MEPLAADTKWAAAVLLAAARLGGLMLAAPVFSHAAAPRMLRVLIALALAVAAADGLAAGPLPTPGAAMLPLMLSEAFVGAVIGYAASLVLAGVELGAAQVEVQMGISLGQAAGGGADGTAGPVGSLWRLLALVVFLAVGGHRDLVGAVMDTFRVVPPGAWDWPGGLLGMVERLLGVSFVLGLKVAAPAVVAILLATVAMGLLHRLLPGCHTLSTGLPARAMLGMLLIALSLAAFSWLVQSAWSMTGRTVAETLRALG